ncbi:hypothetical protein LCGC14_0879380 [marine sediment metagenome]|uniref:DNA polymerase III beta sliding clamp central domain-containing protein n=1 Tax=marine sediment metagenome TaxID=412755 RepID=A0A0F9P789_9ZZZZ
MQVKDLSYLAEISRLAERDPSIVQFFLSERTAQIRGMYCAAIRKSPHRTGIDRTVDLDGRLLAGAIGLMDPEADLALSIASTSVVLRAGGRRAVLRMRTDAAPDDFPSLEKRRSVAVKALHTAVSFLRECTSDATLNPVLTGIMFSSSKHGLILSATDGEKKFGTVALPLKIPAQRQVVPAADLDAALGLLGDKATIYFDGGAIFLSDAHTSIRLSLLQGEFPSMGSLPKPKSYKNEVRFDAEHLKPAIKAATLMDDERMLSLVIKDGSAAWIVQGQEVGGFRILIGKRKADDMSISFNADWVAAAQYVGDKMTMKYKDGRTPVLFVGPNNYLLWASTIVR